MAPDPLAQLRDITTTPVDWYWPLSWQASLLLVIVLAAVVLLTLLLWRKRRHQRALRQTITALKQLPTQVQPQQLMALVKRCALAYAPRHQVASLSGAGWSQWLSQYQTQAEQQLWQQLGEQQYQRQSQVQLDDYLTMLTSTCKGICRSGKPQEEAAC